MPPEATQRHQSVASLPTPELTPGVDGVKSTEHKTVTAYALDRITNDGDTQLREGAPDDAPNDAKSRQPRIQYRDWENFKNRYAVDGAIPAIEVLLAGHDLESEIEDEQLQRWESDRKKRFSMMGGNSSTTRVKADVSFPSKAMAGSETLETQRLERVRINSLAVRTFLTQVTGQTSWEGDRPLTFLKPFKIFLHFHDYMETKLKDLTKDHEAVETRTGDGASQSCTSSVSTQDYLDIKCFVEFVRERLLPSHVKLRKESGARTKVRFAELWSLFSVGDLVFESSDSNAYHQSFDSTNGRGASLLPDRRVWKVYMIQNEDISWTVNGLFPHLMGRPPRRTAEDLNSNFRVHAYRIDYDGTRYGAVPREFSIAPFEGERDVSTLTVYPERFQKDGDAIITGLADRGRRFRSLLERSRQAIRHEGWTLYCDPAGTRLPQPHSTNKVVSEYISSDVIIDFEEVYHRHPVWKPIFSHYHTNTWSPTVKHDLFAIIQWSDTERSQQISRLKEVVVEDDDISELEWNKLAQTDNFIVDDDSRCGLESVPAQGATTQHFELRDLALLPSRLFAYSLRDRKFFNADLRHLSIPQVPQDPFEELKIPQEHKNMIRYTVQHHFDQKKIQKEVHSQGRTYHEQDFIPGKGQGLVMLLHGAPGVGKTATAEAVAYRHKRPLFPITCGDIGIDPHAVERTLSDVFRLANLWDCVLLLDEAEIFLSRREQKDGSLKRNALVSIFLRTLEYYPGVLFLTTNRVGTLDEAINSRVHTTFFYNYLDRAQTLDLFSMNIKRSRMIAEQYADTTGKALLMIQEEEILEFARWNFDARKEKDSSFAWWNGRQIRNAFQTAMSLAYTEPMGEHKYLGKIHFDKVLRAIEHYAKYRQGLQDGTDEEHADSRKERQRPEQQQQMRESQPYQHHQRAFQAPSEPYTPASYAYQQHQIHAGQATTTTPMDAPRSMPLHPAPNSAYQTHGYSAPSPGWIPSEPPQQSIQGGYMSGGLHPEPTTYSSRGNQMLEHRR